MSPGNIWTFLLLLCINAMVYSKPCTWLQDSHKDFPKKMLNNFQHLIPESETSDHCQTNRTLKDTCHLSNAWQAESAAITMREFFYKTIQFYTKHQEKLVSNQRAWENFQEHLNDQASLAKGCNSRTTESWIPTCFSELEKIVEEQNDVVCARWIIHESIKTNLRQATRLSEIMRKEKY